MLTVLIPYYKKVFFRETLLSLSNQVDKRFHVFVCDDDSKDCPKELLKEFNEKFSFTLFKFDENLGGNSLVQQWERCLALVENEKWVMILGDDDVLEPNVVQDFYNNLDEIDSLDIDVVRFSTLIIDGDSKNISKVFCHPKIEKATDSLVRKINNLTRSSLSEYIFKREKFSNYSFKDYPYGLFADDVLILEHSSFNNIFTINSSLIQIRKSNVNLSGGLKLPNRYQAILKFYETLLIEFKQKFDSSQISCIENKIERELFNHRKVSILKFLIKYYLQSFKILKLSRFMLSIFVKIPKLIYLKLVSRI
jgi:glycosyltransferase involved in cell wall biosynthesis